MTVSSSTNRVSYSGNGTLTTFAYTFKVFDQSDLTVILRASNGAETIQTITTDYTVTGVGDVGGGNVVFTTAPTATETVVILREQGLTQGLDLVPNDPFPAQSLEESLDKLTFMVQQHNEELGRAIKASRTNTITGSEFTISAADRANKVFSFDASGDLAVTQELGVWQGDWATSTAFSVRDIVKDASNSNVYICITAHTSSGSTPISTNTDSAKWALLVDAASAASSASAAAASETAAETAQTAAEAAQTAAETAQTAAETAETNAETAETNAETAQAAAEAAQAAAELAYDNFDDRYLGAKASDPTLDNDGDALIDGALYFDTTNNVMKVYDLGGTAWKRTTPTSAEQTNIDTVSGISANVTTVAGISANVTTVAGISSDVTTVAADGTDIGTVAGISANVTTVAGVSSDVTTVAGISADVTTVAADGTDIGTVAGISSDVTAVSGISGNVTTVAGISANVTTVAGISANVTTVAGDTANIGTIATDLNGSDNIGTVAGSISNVNSVGGAISDVTTVASNLTDVQSFANTYRIGTTDPTTSLDTGDLFFNTSSGVLKVYNGSAWEAGVTAGSGFLPLTGGTMTGALDVQSTITSDGLTVEDASSSLLSLMEDGSSGADVEYNGATNNFVISTGTSGSGSQTPRLAIQRDSGDISFYEDTGTTAKFFWDASAESLGIGTSSPLSKMHIEGGDSGASVFTDTYLTVENSGNTRIAILSGTTGIGGIKFGDSGLNRQGGIDYIHSSDAMTFATTNTERMRIDSSGNLLVGTTDTVGGVTGTTPGVAIRADGGVFFTRANADGLNVNRTSSDGAIAQFRKDGTVVGSIGTQGGSLVVGSDNTGFKTHQGVDGIIPYNPSTNSARDAAIDLGYSTNRFKDLYLSGGVVENTTTVTYASSIALTYDNGSIQTVTLTGNVTFTDSLADGEAIVLMLNAGASYTVTWTAVDKWVSSSGNAAPTLTANDTIVLWKIGTTVYAAYAGSYT
jgi:hypothetical protein